MKINIKCPICRANNELTPEMNNCRRCKEDLSLLYQVKAYSFKYRLHLLFNLQQKDIKQLKQLANTAKKLVKPN